MHNKKLFIGFIIVFIIAIILYKYINVNEVTRPVLVTSKEKNNIIIVNSIPDNMPIRIVVTNSNVWNLLIEDQSYLITYSQKLFNKNEYLEQISILYQ